MLYCICTGGKKVQLTNNYINNTMNNNNNQTNQIIVKDTATGEESGYSTILQAAEALEIPADTLPRFIDKQSLIRHRYTVSYL